MRVLRWQTVMEFRLLLRQRETVFFGLVLPLMFLFFVGVAFRSGVYRGYTNVNSLLPPYLTMAVMSIALVNLGISFATQRATGALKRFGGTPLPRLTLVLAKVLSSAVLIAASCGLLTVVSIGLYGIRLQGNPLGAAAALVIGIAAFSAIGIALGGSIAADGAAAVTNAIYLPLLFLGGSFVPVAKLPRPLEDLALALPPAHLVRALDAVLVRGQGIMSTGWDLPIVATWGVAAIMAASRWLSWE
ncbi:MAG TPA: ABC transporter permease [Chloroflexota bacterium]|nr:ABC transporter permease [Chloroflexota bacterium]